MQTLPANRTQIALDVDPVLLEDVLAEVIRDQVKRLFVHGAAFDRVDRAPVGPAVLLETTLQEGHDGRLPAANGSHE